MKNILNIALGGLVGAVVLWYIIFPIFPLATTPTPQKLISQELTQPITPKPSQPPVAHNQSSMDNILELLIKNKEWLFSGIGIVLILGLLSFFRKLINLQKKKPVPYSEPHNLMVITGSPSTPTIIETKPQPYSSPANIIPLESLSPSGIRKAINEAPLLQQEEVTKHYIGLKVKWEGILSSAWTRKDDIVCMIMYSSHIGIFFDVNKNDYPGLGLLKEGAILTVEGIIETVEGNFTLKDARIISVTSHGANSRS